MTAIYYHDKKISYSTLLTMVEKKNVDDPIFPVTNTLDCVVTILSCLIKGKAFFPYSPHLHEKPDISIPEYCDFILHTSGSLKMKYVMFTKQSLIDSCMNTHRAFRLEEGDVYLLNLPLYHVAGLCLMMRAFLRVASIAITPSDPSVITHISMVPAQAAALLNHNPHPHLKGLLLGGSAIKKSLADLLLDKGYPLYITYGMTEMCSHVFVEKYKKTNGLCFFRPLSGRYVKLKDDGTLLVKGKGQCIGYIGQKRVEYHDSKDLFTYKNGEYKVKGRRDRMFISGGENIHPEEIKTALMELSSITKVTIEIKPHLKWGQRPYVAIYTKDQALTKEKVQTHLLSRLEKFKIPKEHEIALYLTSPSAN